MMSRDEDEQQKLTSSLIRRYSDVLAVVKPDPCEHILEQQVSQVDDKDKLMTMSSKTD